MRSRLSSGQKDEQLTISTSSLRDDGILTEKEFASKKAEILSRL